MRKFETQNLFLNKREREKKKQNFAKIRNSKFISNRREREIQNFAKIRNSKFISQQKREREREREMDIVDSPTTTTTTVVEESIECKTSKLKLNRLRNYLRSLSDENEILDSIVATSKKRAIDPSKLDTYFYIGKKKFRSNKEVARFLKLIPPKEPKSKKNPRIFVEKDHVEIGRTFFRSRVLRFFHTHYYLSVHSHTHTRKWIVF